MKAKLLVLVAVIVLVSSCGKDNKTQTTNTTPQKQTETKNTPSQTETKNTTTETKQNTSGALSFEVINNTGVTLVDVFVTPAEQNHWGNDILPNNLFESGSTIKVSIPAEYGETCMFDMKITDLADGHITFTNIDACKLVKLQINADATYEYVATK